MHQKGMPPKQAFKALKANREEIEGDYGGPLDWQELPDRRASRIAAYMKDADVTDRADWPKQYRWIVAQLDGFKRVFGERVRSLVLKETPDETSINEDAEVT